MILCYDRVYLKQLFMKLTVKLDVYNDMAKCNNSDGVSFTPPEQHFLTTLLKKKEKKRGKGKKKKLSYLPEINLSFGDYQAFHAFFLFIFSLFNFVFL